MPSYHLNSANVGEEIYTGKHVELTVAQGASIETVYCITKKENYLLSHTHTHTIYIGTDSSLCHKVYQKHNQANLYVKLGPHKHLYNKLATYQTICLSHICSYPNLWAVLICII
jgi:hypothetical protein